MKAVHLGEIETARIADFLWKPIRSTLEISAFGINAYVAEEAGATLVPEHDELEAGAGGHEELYVVVSGRATFTAGRREVDAPPGTLVFLADPAEPRGARAEEAGTTVVAIGGPAGEPYEPPPWEYWFRSRVAAARGDAEEARAIAREGVRRYPGEEPLARLLQPDGPE